MAADKPFHLQDTDELAMDQVEGQEGQDEQDQSGKGKAVRVGKVDIDPAISYETFKASGPGLDSAATIDEEGIINVTLNLKKALGDLPDDYARPVKEYEVDKSVPLLCPPLNIVIFIVGSRGDVQPYLSLAIHMILTGPHHRVRIATHNDFESFVLDSGRTALKGAKGKGPGGEELDLEGRLEFFGIGGDPKELMAYMVKNPGLLPGIESLTNGDIGSKRKMTAEMLHNFHQSTFSPDPVSGEPFAVDAILSNPPAFAHVHVAESLGVPLTMSFTMPWCPTTSFSHPLVNIKQSNAERGLTNYLSYAMAEMLTWQGLGDVINKWRAEDLALPPLSMRSGASVLDRLKVPYLYCWSPALIPKPADWMEHIDITGFLFLQNKGYKPEKDLADFLAKGPPPVYIGFGSVVVDDPDGMTRTILEAVKKAGVRALISAGWGKVGGDNVPDDVFILGNVPHDWMFAEGRVSAICIHGGAGTTAIGLRNGLPTIVVPFFGDQPFWGAMIAKAGAGPDPIPHKELTADKLADALKYAVSPKAKKAAEKMGEHIRNEDGEDQCLAAFHRHLPLLNMRCQVDPDRVALWWSDDLALRLSGLAAQTLADAKLLDMKKLEPHRPKEYDTRRPITDPISGGGVAIFSTITNYYSSIAQIFVNPPKGILNTYTAIPKGILNIVSSMHEGFESLPELYGSQPRHEKAHVTDFQSGVKAAGKGLFNGYYDAITGLVTEPLEGGKKEGFLGVLKGAGRSYINATVRPAAGILGVIAHPANGIFRSAQKMMKPATEDVLLKPRQDLSVRDFSNASQEQKRKILAKYKELEKKTGERRAELRKKAKEYIAAATQEQKEADERQKKEEEEGVEKADDSQVIKVKVKPTQEEPAQVEPEQQQSQEKAPPAEKSAGEEETDPVKLAEQRGYERALAEMQAKLAAQKGS